MSTINKKGAVLVVALGTALFASAANADIIIDNFTDVGNGNPWPLMVNANSMSASTNESGLTGVLGGNRFTELQLVTSQAPFDNANAAIYPTFGLLDFNSTSGAGAWLQLTYAGDGGLNADLSGEQGINIDYVLFDLGSGAPTGVSITISDGQNSASLTNSLTVPGAQQSQYNFANFANIGNVNLAAVQSIVVKFNIDANLGVDFRVNSITTYIPAPGAMALLGLAGLVGTRRRR